MKTVETRYTAKKSSSSNGWMVYDNDRKVIILRSATPQAKYNQEVCEKVVTLLNLNP